jgi:hypothetical protein
MRVSAACRLSPNLGDPLAIRLGRSDRNEPQLKRTPPGDPHDTATPAAMAVKLQKRILGKVLSPTFCEQLSGWMLGRKPETTGCVPAYGKTGGSATKPAAMAIGQMLAHYPSHNLCCANDTRFWIWDIGHSIHTDRLHPGFPRMSRGSTCRKDLTLVRAMLKSGHIPISTAADKFHGRVLLSTEMLARSGSQRVSLPCRS